MKPQTLLKDLNVGMDYTGYLLVCRAERRITKDNREFLTMRLCDVSAKIDAIMWHNFKNVPEVNEIVYIDNSQVDEHNGRPQLRVNWMKHVSPEEDVDTSIVAPFEENEEAFDENGLQRKLSELKRGQRFEGFLLVRKAAKMSTKTRGREFLSMTLCDAEMEVNAMQFDGITMVPEAGDIIHVCSATMDEFKNKLQLKVNKIEPRKPEDDVDMRRIVPSAPEPAEDMASRIRARAEKIADDEIRTLVLARLEACGEALMYFPAARSLHHAERAGLLHHTDTMLRMADGVCEIYTHLDADLLAAGVILHDLCKIQEMNSDCYGVVSAYTAEGELIGHLVQGVAQLAVLGEKLGIRGEKLLLLQHMILSHHDLPEYGSPKQPMFPEAEVLHILDLMDARMFEMRRELNNVQPGGFTERVWSLERRLYRRKEDNDE